MAGGTDAITHWDLSIAVDGPGTRFVAFTAGCPLRCLYCSNPETWRMHDGHRTIVDEIMAEAGKYRRFIDVTHGGITVAGGEPLLQPAFTGEILGRAHAGGMRTALDTSGLLGDRACDDLLAATDLVLLDIKSWDPATYHHLTGAEIEPTLRFARLHRTAWIRFVLVPGVTDAEENVEGVAAFTASLGNVEYVDVLPFHTLGAVKYRELGLRFPLAGVAPPDETLVALVRGQFGSHGLTVRC